MPHHYSAAYLAAQTVTVVVDAEFVLVLSLQTIPSAFLLNPAQFPTRFVQRRISIRSQNYFSVSLTPMRLLNIGHGRGGRSHLNQAPGPCSWL